MTSMCIYYFFFFFNDTATTEIYTLSLHDALPISLVAGPGIKDPVPKGPSLLRHVLPPFTLVRGATLALPKCSGDRKSTRLNSSHANISYAVFCLKKKNILRFITHPTLTTLSIRLQ